MVAAYNNLRYVERDFRHIKSGDLDLRPVFHRLEERVRAHTLICMLACYLTWHLRRARAPLTYTDENPPRQENPVARPAARVAACTRASQVAPLIEVCASACPALSCPEECSAATREQVPEPQGERSTSPSAKTVTLRCRSDPSGPGPSSSK